MRRPERIDAGALGAAVLSLLGAAAIASSSRAQADAPQAVAARSAAWLAASTPAAVLDASRYRAPQPALLVGLAGEPLSPPSEAPAEAVASAFIQREIAPAGELAWMSTVTGGGGVRFLTFEQRFGGVPVALGRIGVAVAADGSVLSARVGELAAAGPPPAARLLPALDAVGARAAAFAVLASPGAEALSDDIAVEPVLLPSENGPASRAWRVRCGLRDRAGERWQVTVDGESGRRLSAVPMTFNAVEAAHVFPRSPLHPMAWVEIPDPVSRPSVDSPAGWCYDVDTRGNNVWVQLDREGDFFPPYGETARASGAPLAFDFPYTGVPADDAALAMTNVFWAVNDAHDRFRALGFDEAAGAMQEDNFGRGGNGRDRTWALVQYASGDGTTPYESVGLGVGGDGSFTYLVVGVFRDQDGVLRDGALDTGLLYHEVAHGVSTRLVGDDPACMVGIQPQALSEGWSDFFAASFTDDPVIGAFTSGNLQFGQRTSPVGNNGYTLSTLCSEGCDRFRDGEIWSSALWDMRSDLASRLGRATGIALAERLVVEGMRHAPCRPTFQQARDGILVADVALSAGADRCSLWAAFAGRGIGWSSRSAGSDDMVPLPGFDLPPECRGGSSIRFDEAEYATEGEAVVEVVDASPGLPATATVSTSGGDVLIVPLTPVSGGPVLRGSVTLARGAPNPADGLLQVAGGDRLTATYESVSTQASVSDVATLTVVEHHVYGNWCQVDDDDDAVPGWYVLPGFLDAGEVATVSVTLGNATNGDLEDAVVVLTSLNPHVRVLPASIPLGRILRQGGSAPRRFAVEFRAEASPSATPGETADIRFDITSRGRSGVALLRLILDMDYVLEADRSPFLGGTETFDPIASPSASSWATSTARGSLNEWQAEACAGTAGSWGWRVGQPSCAPYVDGQVATALVSPPLLSMPPDAVGIRVRELAWANDVDLWTDRANPYCDADMVAAFSTIDPAALPFEEPANVFAHDPRRVWLFPDTTPGYVAQGPYGLDTSPMNLVAGFPYDRLRLAWVFWGDVFDCGFETANSGHYRLDDVRFVYDVVRAVPETTPCTADCVLSVRLEAIPPGPKCPGEVFTLSAVGTEALNCAGPIRFGFSGPGVPPESGWTLEDESPAIGASGETYAVYARCETDPDCDDYRQFVNVSPASPGLGGPEPASLRVRRLGDDVLLTWRGAAVPPAYGVYLAASRSELLAGAATWPLAGVVDGEGARGEGAWREAGGALLGGAAYYLVAGRDACTGRPRLP